MTWSKFDDLYDEHENVEEAWFAFPPNPVGLHVMATTACNRWLSDGVIRPRWLERMLPKQRDHEQILAAMLDHNLFDLLLAGATLALLDSDGVEVVLGPFAEDRYVVHDFLDHHDSRRQIKDRRAKDAARKRNGRRSESPGDSAENPKGVRADSDGSPAPPAGAGARVPTRPDPTSRPPQPPASGGRARTRVKWEGDVLAWARGVGVDGPDATLLRALGQAVPWRANGEAHDTFRAFVAQHFPSTLTVKEDA